MLHTANPLRPQCRHSVSKTFTDSFRYAAQSPFLSQQNYLYLYFRTLSSLVRRILKSYVKYMLKFKCPNSLPREKENTHADCQLLTQSLCLLYQVATCFGDIFGLYRELHVCSTCTAYMANCHKRLTDRLHMHIIQEEYSDDCH